MKSRKLRLMGNAASEGEKGCIQRFVGEPERKRLLGRNRYRWQDNNKIDLQEVEWVSFDCFELSQDRDRWLAFVKGVHKMREFLD
jgi:hypothetical protein